MYSRRIICSVFLYSFCQLNVTNAASVIFKKSQPTVTTTKHVTNNSTFFVTTRSGFDGTVEHEACKCVEFYGCKNENSYEIPGNPNACSSTDVCCRVPTPLVPGIFLDPDTTSEDLKSQETTTVPGSPCQCMSYSECGTSPNENDEVGIINPKPAVDCALGEVCCYKRISTSHATPQLKCGERRGVSFLDVRVLAPEDSSSTSFGEFPFMASVWAKRDEFVCGASLISSNMLLTAAHCVNKKDYSQLSVRVGDYDIKAETAEEVTPYEEKIVSTVVVHPNFNAQTLVNDLAIIVTSDEFKFDHHVSPVCTIAYGPEFADSHAYDPDTCLATGWGKSSGEKLSATLKKVELGLVPLNRCEEKLRKTRLGQYFNLHSSFLCAGGREGFDTCKGDGGGPLVCPLLSDPHRYVQVGVTSWGVSCGSDTPGVYTSLETNNEWISSVYDQYKSSDSAFTESNNLEVSRRKL